MTPKPFDAGMLRELERRKDAFPIDADLGWRLTRSTVDEDTLRLLGMLIVWKQPNHIFSFGAGLPIIFFARLQQRLGVVSRLPLVSIDHSQRCLGETRRALTGGCPVQFVHAPLAVTELSHRVYTTYHPSYLQALPDDVRFDFVFIDGPPAFRYGREAPLYHLAPKLSPNAVLVLNDAAREPEREALRNWERMWPDGFAAVQFPGVNKGIAVVRIGTPVPADPTVEARRRDDAEVDRVVAMATAESCGAARSIS